MQLNFWVQVFVKLLLQDLVIIARQSHFNYTKPDRTWQVMLKLMSSQPIDHWPFVREQTLKEFQNG
ncbi:Hypothetical predicted protein [Olea europaea subsp. europaea]|uniref:Uncharacterized protein n=1 Tax=Olea europaea subsp. europaea TaxID=158383 RepID=A0A8S0PII3_OLEEU|nr:Hypothetical predicted protein [Olea europaea subsp. europaea]